MATLRTINHPAVEIKEYDQSLYTPLAGGTTSLLMGFASKGEDNTPYEVTSRESLLNYYGQPTNEAERYFYYGATDILVNKGKLITAKLPYNNESANMFKVSVYNVDTEIDLTDDTNDDAKKIVTSYRLADLSGLTPEDDSIAGGYVYLADLPGYDKALKITSDANTFTLATSTVEEYRVGTSVPTSGTFCIIDKNKSVLSKDLYNNNDQEVLGIFPVITTALNALPVQNMLNIRAPNEALNNVTPLNIGYNSISGITTDDLSPSVLNTYGYAVPLNELTYLKESLSRNLAKAFPTITYSQNTSGETILDPSNMNKLMISVIAMKIDPNYNNKITFVTLESFVGSLDPVSKKDDGISDYLGNIINSNSNYIEFYGSMPSDKLAGTDSFYFADNLKSVSLGFTLAETIKDLNAGAVLQGIDTILDKLSNLDEIELDIIVDAGLSNILQYISDKGFGTSGDIYYDPEGANGTFTITDTISTSGLTGEGGFEEIILAGPTSYAWTNRINSSENTELWRTVISKYVDFCSKTRKDCIFYADGLRTLALEGKNKIVRNGVTPTIDFDILPRLKFLTGINNNYGAMDIIWDKRIDTFTGVSFWCPPSIARTVSTIYTDNSFNYWEVPAGFTRGVVNGAVDISFNPNGSQADSIYSKAFNYMQKYPLDGIILEGQKTLQTKPSAFDRINVRRLFLKLERLCRRTLRWYIYELNNLQLRNRIYDQLDSILAPVKVAGGIYDYAINLEDVNTASVIDNNELRCVIMIKPTKAAEYIIATFVALSTGMSFSEVNLAQVS